MPLCMHLMARESGASLILFCLEGLMLDRLGMPLALFGSLDKVKAYSAYWAIKHRLYAHISASAT